MSEWIKMLFVKIFGTHSEIATFLISMIPIVELRGAIPFGAATSLWGENALPLWASFGVSVLGSSLVCVILTFAFWPLFNWLKKTKFFKKIADFVERKLNKNSKSIDKKTKDERDEKRILRLKILGIFAFVAIPLPLTGVWTGTCLALFIGLSKKWTMASVITGNIIAGLLMTMISYFFADNTMVVLLAFLILVVLFVLFEVIKSFIEKRKAKKTQQKEEQKNETEEVVESSLQKEEDIESEIVEQSEKNEKPILSQIKTNNKQEKKDDN